MKNATFVARLGLRGLASNAALAVTTPFQRYVTGPILKARNAHRPVRKLEIGPGADRIEGFETLNVVGGRHVDYVGDATRKLPFPADSFDLIYASHILEHVAWYQAGKTVDEWVRVLKPGGALEIWVPDGLKIAQAFVEAETVGGTPHAQDGWWRFNPDKDPCMWMSGRLFSYGDGTGRRGHFNWHLATYSERRLSDLLRRAGLVNIRGMGRDEVRGYDHGWINLGVRGEKPQRDAGVSARRAASA